jgi:hypothetical protein
LLSITLDHVYEADNWKLLLYRLLIESTSAFVDRIARRLKLTHSA